MRIGGRGHASPACATRAARVARGASSGRSAPQRRRRSLRRGSGAGCEALDLVDEQRRRDHVDSVRADELRHEPLGAAVVPVHDRARELGRVLVERPRDGEQPAADLQQVAEVERPLLDALVLGVEHGQHGPADDRRLDHRARVQADHRPAVVDRVEVVGLRLVVGRRVARPGEHDDAGDLDAVPGVGPLRVRADEHAQLGDGIAAAGAAPPSTAGRSRPPTGRSRASSTRRARTADRDRGPRGRRTRRRGRGCHSNHSSKHCAPVTTTCAGIDPVQPPGLVALHLVPDEESVRDGADDRLAGQVVPALDQHRGAQPERLGGAEEVPAARSAGPGTA